VCASPVPPAPRKESPASCARVPTGLVEVAPRALRPFSCECARQRRARWRVGASEDRMRTSPAASHRHCATSTPSEGRPVAAASHPTPSTCIATSRRSTATRPCRGSARRRGPASRDPSARGGPGLVPPHAPQRPECPARARGRQDAHPARQSRFLSRDLSFGGLVARPRVCVRAQLAARTGVSRVPSQYRGSPGCTGAKGETRDRGRARAHLAQSPETARRERLSECASPERPVKGGRTHRTWPQPRRTDSPMALTGPAVPGGHARAVVGGASVVAKLSLPRFL
jgi:hypothetical protein